MLSSLSRKLSVLQTSSADKLARQQFRGFNIFTDNLMLSTPATIVSSHLSVVKKSHA